MNKKNTADKEKEIEKGIEAEIKNELKSELKNELREKLKVNLPAYMIPTSLDQMDEFPLNKNGKIDRKALFAIKRSK